MITSKHDLVTISLNEVDIWWPICSNVAVLSLPGRNHNNGYFRLLCDSLEEEGATIVNIRERKAWAFKFDILHIHFPTHFVTETTLVAAIFWAGAFAVFFLVTKFLRKPIVYTVHNVVPFNIHREWLLWPYLALVHHCSNAFIFLNKSSQAEFYRRFPAQKTKMFVTVPLGPYATILRSVEQRLRKRSELTNLPNAFIVGFLGSIKRYKSLEILKYLPLKLAEGRPLQVVVAGRIEKQYSVEANAILDRLAPSQLMRIDRSLTDAELDELIQAVDVVLLPYTHGWNSSAAALVLSNRRRIIASDLPMFRDLDDALGQPWVRLVNSDTEHVGESFSRALELASTDQITESDQSRLSSFLQDTSFEVGAREIAGLYRRLVYRMAAND